MKYPVWLPYPSCWFRALILFICMVPVGVALYAFQGFGKLSLIFSLIFFENISWVFWLFCILLVLANFIPIYILANIDQFLWSEPHPKFPNWLPNPGSLIEGTFAWGMIIFSILMTIALLCDDLNRCSADRSSSQYNHLVQVAPTIWIIVTAYLYQIRYFIMRLIKRYRSAKKQ